MAGPSPSFSPRKIFTDSNYQGDAFLKGLGNANVSPFADVVEGIASGIKLGSAAIDLYDKISPEAQELKRLELETKKAQAETAKNQATITGVKAHSDAINEAAIIAADTTDLKKRALDSQLALENHQKLNEAIDAMSQINDPASLTQLINDKNYAHLLTDKDFAAQIKNKAATLLRQTDNPQDEVNLIRTVAGIDPAAAKTMEGFASKEAQLAIASPVQAAAYERATTPKPVKQSAFQEKIGFQDKLINDYINNSIPKIDPNTQDVRIVPPGSSFDDPEGTPDPTNISGGVQIVPKDGGPVKTIPFPQAIGKELQPYVAQKIGEAIKSGSIGAGNNQRSVASEVSSADTIPSVAIADAQTIVQVAKTEAGSQTLQLRSQIFNDTKNPEFDNTIKSITTIAKNSDTFGEDEKSSVRKIVHKALSDSPVVYPKALENKIIDAAIASAEQIYKQNQGRQTYASNLRTKQEATATITDKQKEHRAGVQLTDFEKFALGR